MRIAREEIFGPVLGVFKWSDESKMLEEVNAVEYGLTASIWTNDLSTAHRTAAAVEAGYVWINEVGKHFLGAPFGGYKQSGIGREEWFRGDARVYAGEEHSRAAAAEIVIPEAAARRLSGTHNHDFVDDARSVKTCSFRGYGSRLSLRSAGMTTAIYSLYVSNVVGWNSSSTLTSRDDRPCLWCCARK